MNNIKLENSKPEREHEIIRDKYIKREKAK